MEYNTKNDKLNGDIIPIFETSKKNIVSVLELRDCSGCSACVNICPTDALSLLSDDHGFYRSAVADIKCIECDACIKVCPALKLPVNTNTREPKCYAFIANDTKLLYDSSSGGAFTLLAKQIFQSNGFVCGVAWKDDFSVEHIMIDNENDLYKLQKSKYLQSYVGDMHKKIKNKLTDGFPVLFTGAPCQVAGLRAYLGKNYEKLIAIDILCGNSPSTMFFKKYINEVSNDLAVKRYEFRHKVKGWNATSVALTFSDGTTQVRHGGKEDAYQSIYHNHTMCPHHCENCKYQALPRIGDLTIGDFWGIGKKDPSINTSKGVTVILINNEKGEVFLNSVPTNEISLMKKVPLSWLGGNGYARGNKNFASPHRDRFFKAIKTKTFSESIKYALNVKTLDDLGFSPLQYASNMLHFKFNSDAWEEHFIRNMTTLMVKDGYSKIGVRAVLPLAYKLQKDRNYRLKIRFKVKTQSSIINFHLYDSVNQKQVILSSKPSGNESYQEYSKVFIPDSGNYNSFMVGAVHISGEGNYLAVDYVFIVEERRIIRNLGSEIDLLRKPQKNMRKLTEGLAHKIKNSKTLLSELLLYEKKNLKN